MNAARWWARAPLVEVCLVALWLGAALFFAAAVARAAFDLFDAALAGALVGRVLPPLFVAGIVTGLVALATELRWPRRGRGVRSASAAIVAAACAAAQLVIAPTIERVRTAVARPIAEIAPDDPRRREFGRLHALSVLSLGVAMLGAVTVIASAARVAGSEGGEGGDRGA